MANGIPAKQKKRMKQVMFIFLLICLPVLVFSIFNISVINHEKYESMAINQQTSDSVLTLKRSTKKMILKLSLLQRVFRKYLAWIMIQYIKRRRPIPFISS